MAYVIDSFIILRQDVICVEKNYLSGAGAMQNYMVVFCAVKTVAALGLAAIASLSDIDSGNVQSFSQMRNQAEILLLLWNSIRHANQNC